MSRFKVSKPQEEVDLRQWEPGRVSQLKLFLGHLQNAVNTPLAAQVAQSPKRKFSEFVPRIVEQDLTIQVAFREIRAQFIAPRGLRDLLFYESQFSTFENFANFDLFTASIPSFVYPSLTDNTTYYLRIRVVTKNGLIGPWSDVESATTPFSQGFGLFDGTEIKVLAGTDTFQTIWERTYTAIGGKAYYSIDYDAEIQITGRDLTKNLEWGDVELQWIVDDNQVGQNFLLTVYGTNNTATGIGDDLEARTADIGDFDNSDGTPANTDPRDSLFIPGVFSFEKRGTFIQKFTELAIGDHTFQLKARKLPSSAHPLPNDWIFLDATEAAAATPTPVDPAQTEVIYNSNVIFKLRNFNVFETLTD